MNTVCSNFNKNQNYNNLIEYENDNNISFRSSSSVITTKTIDTINDITLLNHDELHAIIRSILITRVKDGATIQEIRNDYYNLIGEKFPIDDNVTDYLLSIPNITCYVNENRCRIFNITTSEKCQHIIDMVKNQKPSRHLNNNQNQQQQQQHYQDQINQNNNEQLKQLQQHENLEENNNLKNASQYNNNLNYIHRNFNYIQQEQPFQNKKKSQQHIKDFILNNNNENNIQQSNNYFLNYNNNKSKNYKYNQYQKYQQQYQQQNHFYLLDNYNKNQQQNLIRCDTPTNENYNNDNIEIKKLTDYILYNNDNHNYNDDIDNNICYFQDNYKYLYNKISGSTETLSTKPTTWTTSNTSFNSHYETEMMRNFDNPFQNKNMDLPYFINNNNNSYNKYQHQQNQNQQKQNQIFDDVARIHDYQLLGDDFFLSLARAEIGCKFKRGNFRRQSGLCISGQTIQEAAFRILNEENLHKKIIINIGSVDILQGHHLIDIQQDFLQLLIAFNKRQIKPILTTLAPLANSGHKPDVKKILESFNDFIRKSGLPYIDIWSTMVNQYGNTYYDCYQSGAKYVTGSIYPHVFWNKIGRQRILNHIKSELAFL